MAWQKILAMKFVMNYVMNLSQELDPEDIGNEICNELCWRSFFQVVEQDKLHYKEKFEMHDLVHDLAQSITIDECLITTAQSSDNISKRIFHVTVVTDSEQSYPFPRALYDVESLRTFILNRLYMNRSKFSCDFSRLRSLRVFGARDARLMNLSSIGCLKHLRYLDLSHTSIQMLPDSICSLFNLLTLKLEYCKVLRELDKQMKRLKNLRHLYLNYCLSLSHMPPKIGEITCLKTLTLFVVGKSRGFHLMELKELNLEGKLHIENLHRVANQMDAKEANLVGSLKLHRISGVLYIDHNLQGGGMMKQFLSLESLTIRDLPSLQRLLREEGREILPCLTSLEIQNCPNLIFPCLPSLKFLEVLDCNEELLRSISNISSITSLRLYNNNELICLPQGMLQNLTCLESLVIKYFNKLKELPTGLNSINAFESISICHCNELESFSEQSPEGLNRLKKLCIRECRKFTSLPDGLQYLSSLESLTLSCCPELVSLPNGIRHLSSLQSLMMSGQYTSGNSLINPIGCPKLAVLPEALQHVAALQSLHISGYPDLASLPHWLGDLTSLHSSIIVGCPKLSSLPASIQSLTDLQEQAISQCPELMKRCEKEIGEYWYKIAHVLYVYVDPVALTEVEPCPIELKFDPLQIH